MSNSRLLESVRKKRRHAGFFSWPDRSVAERSVVQLFSEAAEAIGEAGLTDVSSVVADPPDCEARGSRGERIGIEVTELVDQRLAGQRVLSTPPKFWEGEEVADRLGQIIEKKDRKCAQVRGFDRLMLLIHTDEVLLTGYAGDDVLEFVRQATFQCPRRFDEVVFMVSYDARLQTYPWVRLRFAKK